MIKLSKTQTSMIVFPVERYRAVLLSCVVSQCSPDYILDLWDFNLPCNYLINEQKVYLIKHTCMCSVLRYSIFERIRRIK